MTDYKLQDVPSGAITSNQAGDIVFVTRDPTGSPADYYEKVSNLVRDYPCNARLTLTTNLPVTTADVTAAGTLYWTPYKGDRVALYYNSEWIDYPLTEKSLALTLTSANMYDVFGYYTGSAPALETLVWSNATTRATALTTQNGILVKSGDATRRYLGSLYASGANITESSESQRLLYNYYNRVLLPLKARDATNSWAYTTAAYREVNGGTTYGTSRVGFVVGWPEDIITAKAMVAASVSSGTPGVAAGIGLDNATNAAIINQQTIVAAALVSYVSAAEYQASIPVGFHYLAWLEYGGANVTMYGDNGGTVFRTGLIASAWM